MDYLNGLMMRLSCRKRRYYKIFMFGLEGSGKTSLLHKLTPDDHMCTQTHGFTVENIERGNATLVVWDLGRRTHIMSVKELWSRYFAMPRLQHRGVIFVIDSTDMIKLEEAKEELHSVLEECDSSTVLLVLANKQDVETAMSPDDISSYLNLNNCEIAWQVKGISAVTSKGLNEAINWLQQKLSR